MSTMMDTFQKLLEKRNTFSKRAVFFLNESSLYQAVKLKGRGVLHGLHSCSPFLEFHSRMDQDGS